MEHAHVGTNKEWEACHMRFLSVARQNNNSKSKNKNNNNNGTVVHHPPNKWPAHVHLGLDHVALASHGLDLVVVVVLVGVVIILFCLPRP
jgi:hypothetical protein